MANIAQLVEHVHGKDEVIGSIPIVGSRMRPLYFKVVVLFLVLTWSGFFLSSQIDLSTADLGRHIANGRVLVEAPWAEKWGVLHTNFFSYTMPRAEFVNHHWLSGVVFYLVEYLSGFVGLSIFYVLISISSILLFWNVARKLSNFYLASLLVFLLTPLLAYRAEVRPEMWTYFFSGIFLNLLFFRRHLWLLPVLTLLWVNLHIGFVFGFLILGSFGLEELVKRVRGMENDFSQIFYISLASFLLALVNPFGYKLLLYPFQIFQDYGYRIVENQSVRFLEGINFTQGMHFLLYKILGVGVVLAVVGAKWGRLRVPLSITVSTLVLLVISYFGVRHIALFSLFALVLLSTFLYNFSREKYFDYCVLLVVFVSVFSLISGSQDLLERKDRIGWGLASGQSASADFFRGNHLSGLIFNNYDVGGYLIYHLYPEEKVYVDNRPEAYNKEFFSRGYILPQESEERWRELEKQYGFNVIFFSHRDYTPWGQKFLSERLRDESWVPVFVDSYNIIFLKRNTLNMELISKFAIPRDQFGVAPNQ